MHELWSENKSDDKLTFQFGFIYCILYLEGNKTTQQLKENCSSSTCCKGKLSFPKTRNEE